MKKWMVTLLVVALCVSAFLLFYGKGEAEKIDFAVDKGAQKIDIVVVDETEETETLSVGNQYVQVDKALTAAERERLVELITEFGFEPEGIVCGVQSQTDDPLLSAGAPDILESSEFQTDLILQKLSGSGHKEYKLSAVGAWAYGISSRFGRIKNDVFAINWSDEFTIDTQKGENGFRATTFYYNTESKEMVQIEDKAKLFDIALEVGGAYLIPTYVIENNVGHLLWCVQVDAYIYKLSTESGSAKAIAQYAHAKNENGISGVLFSPRAVSIDFSGEHIESVAEPSLIGWEY